MCPQVHDALGFTNAQKYGFAIGASAVSPETVKFFLSLDMKLLEMISQTEMTAFVQLTNTPEPGGFRVGRVGREYSDQCQIKMINTDEVQRVSCLLYVFTIMKIMCALEVQTTD